MRIVELNFEGGWRGGERQTLYNMQGFRNAGEEVLLVCRKSCALEKKALEEGFKVFSYSNIFGVIFFLITKGGEFNILHAQTSHILTYCLLTRPFHRRKIVFSRRVDFVPKGSLTRLKYQATDKLIAISTAVRNIIADFSKRNDVEIISDIAVAQALNRERAIEEMKRLGIEAGTRIVATTAALVPHKDPLTMVEAIRDLARHRNNFIFLHFGNGPLESEVRIKIEEYQLQDHYKLMGYFEKVEDFFSVFEVFVMSSQEEGLGSSVLDAFLYKVPVVSTNAGGLSDLVNDERGIVCKVKDYQALARGIDELLDRKDKEELLSNAFAYVTSYHNSQYVTGQYLSVMKALVSS